MKNIILFLFFAAVGLSGCKTAPDEERTELLLSVSGHESSKAGSLTAGDEVAVYARVEGTERYFLEAAKFTAGADGKTLSTTPAVHYPETKQAVQFYTYFPYHTGTFSAPTDQSTVAALKQADLCWATASSTPVSIVPLTFQHLFARLIVQTNQPTSKIACRVVPSGTLNPVAGVFTLNNTQSEVSTTGNELILPAQPLSRLVLTVANIEYVFDGSLSLLAGQTTTLNLTLHPNTKTATLNGSTTTKWGAATGTGDTNAPINNQLKLHWAAPHAAYAAANKVTLTLENPTTKATQTIDVVPSLVAAESSTAACTYTLPVSLAANSGLWYPYTVTHAKIYQGSTLLREATPEAMKGTTVYRSGPQTMAINRYIQVRDAATNTTDIKEWLNVDKDFGSMLVKVTTVGCTNWTAVVEGGDGVNVQPSSGASGQVVRLNWSPNLTASAKTGRIVQFFPTGSPTAYTPLVTSQQAGPTTKAVLINGVYWATGNLIADGANGCKIGVQTDAGLYFQFASLIGWSGGGTPNYDGTGTPTNHTAIIKVKPSTLNATYDPKNVWPTGGSNTMLNKPYFSVTAAPYNGVNSNIHGYAGNPASGVGVDVSKTNLLEGRYAPMGVGDPCAYYLGSGWKMPTYDILRSSWGLSSPYPYTFQAPSKVSINKNNITVGGVTYLFNVRHYRLTNGQYSTGTAYAFFLLATLTTYSEPTLTSPSVSLATFSMTESITATHVHTWSGHSDFNSQDKAFSGIVVRCVK